MNITFYFSEIEEFSPNCIPYHSAASLVLNVLLIHYWSDAIVIHA